MRADNISWGPLGALYQGQLFICCVFMCMLKKVDAAFTSLEKCLSLFIWQHKHKTISDSLTAQQLISNTPKTKTYLQPCLILPRWTSLDPSALSFLTLPAMVTSSPLLFSSPLLCPLISFSFSLLSTGFTSSCVVPSPPSPSSPLLLLCCVHVGSDSLQKGGLQPRHLTLGLQGQYQACSWWRECKYCVACIQSLYASAR